MIKGFYPNRTIANSQRRLNRQKTTVATIGTVATISQNTGSTYTGFTGVVIREANATSNFYPNGFNGSGISAGNNGAGDRSHSILNISGISNIPANSVITNVVMRLYLSSTGGSYSIAVRKLVGISDVTQTNWTVRVTGTNWGTAGALLDGTDRTSTVLASAAVVINQTGNLDFSGANLKHLGSLNKISSTIALFSTICGC